MPTPSRTLRIPDDVWQAAQRKARHLSAERDERVTVNAVIVDLLRDWSAGP